MNENVESGKPPKEYIELLERNLYVKEMGIENRLKEVQQAIENSIEPGKKRFQLLRQQLDLAFPPNSIKRGIADGLTFFFLDSAFELFFIGNNSALFIELHGLLERFCVHTACEFIAVDDVANTILQDAFSKKTLNDIADYFKIISFWTEDDVKFIRKLSHVRNGIAHKNVELVSKHIGDGKKQLMTSIDDITKQIDAIPYIITTIELLLKISDAAKPAFFKHPRFKGRLEAYSSVIGRVMNMFCEPEFISLPNVVKFTMLNRIFGKAYLLASQGLRDAIDAYREIVIDFQDALGVDDEKADRLHEDLMKSSLDIYNTMRADLEIDGDSSVFVKPKPIKIDYTKIKRSNQK